MVLRKLSQTFKVTLALMLSVVSTGVLTVSPAFATNPVVTGDAVCNTQTGKYDITWTVKGDAAYPNETATIKSQTRTTTPTLVGKTVKGPGTVSGTETGLDAGTYDQTVQVQWTNYPTGTLISQSDSVTTPTGNCVITPVVDPCAANYFPVEKMWEITWGRQFSDTGSAPTFTMDSNGGLISLNGGPVPSYMTSSPDWYWLYVTVSQVQNGRTVTYGFADGTTRKAVVSADANNCPSVAWTTTPPPTVTTCPAVLNTNHSTNVSKNGWTLPTDAEYVNGGVKLNVSGSWDETYIERAFVGPLADIGSQVDFTANPTQFAGIHIVTSKGILVYEKEGSYAGKWWSTSNFGVASGMGYQTFDTLANIVAANPGVTTSALRMLYTSPDVSSSTINSIIVGCTIYTFTAAIGQGGGTPTPTPTPTTPPTTTTNPGQTLGTSTTAGGQGGGQMLGTSTTLPAVLPATGSASATNPFMIIAASLLAYGAAYFLQGRRVLGHKEA